ncbi:MAG: CHAD domain-containing protein [Polyangiaceae bacterium]
MGRAGHRRHAIALLAHAHVRPLVEAECRDVREAAERVALTAEGSHADAEAIHDYRVALRRLRTLLAAAASLFKRRPLRRVRDGLRALAHTAGAVRDEEVLVETLTELELPSATRAHVDAWLEGRTPRERKLRRAVIAHLSHGAPRAKEPVAQAEPAVQPELAAKREESAMSAMPTAQEGPAVQPELAAQGEESAMPTVQAGPAVQSELAAQGELAAKAELANQAEPMAQPELAAQRESAEPVAQAEPAAQLELAARVAGAPLPEAVVAARPPPLGRLLSLVEALPLRKRAAAVSTRALAIGALQGAAGKAIEEAAREDADTPEGRHRLRIRWKRVRYTGERFGKVLAREGVDAGAVAVLVKTATRMQKKLGELHDIDEAIGSVARARALSRGDRMVVHHRLRVRRKALAERLAAELPAALDLLRGEPPQG